jgi:hypothetical protein
MDGENPNFVDDKKYSNILLTPDAAEYFRKHLEIRFIDENYPVTGIARGGYGMTQGDEDLIGTAIIPLEDLA